MLLTLLEKLDVDLTLLQALGRVLLLQNRSRCFVFVCVCLRVCLTYVAVVVLSIQMFVDCSLEIQQSFLDVFSKSKCLQTDSSS